MTTEKIYAFTVPAAIAAVILGFFALVSGCQERDQIFRTGCVTKGGTVISSGDKTHCIMNGKSTP